MSRATKKLEVESIDQILEKIKKAINDDTNKLDNSATSTRSKEEEDDDILELTNVVSNPKQSEEEHSIEDETFDLISQHVKKFTSKLNLLMKGNYVVSEKEVREIFKETLRPYLKSWLNNNLKDIVKDVLEVEIKKIFKKII